MWFVLLTCLPQYKVYLIDWRAYHLDVAGTYVVCVIYMIHPPVL